ncbi:MAG: hypothetical protein WC768_04685 [Patescibacteria group bacterium]|jgi:hypothetical protein
MKTKMLFPVLLLVLLSGCASLGPYAVDPGVYRSSRDKIVARDKASQSYAEAHEAYAQELAKSYRAGTGGKVEQVGQRLRAPAEYLSGVLINHRGKTVTYHIKGKVSVVQDVWGTTASIELPAGEYRVELYDAGSSYPYRSGSVILSNGRGGTTVNGEVYDFSITAP